MLRPLAPLVASLLVGGAVVALPSAPAARVVACSPLTKVSGDTTTYGRLCVDTVITQQYIVDSVKVATQPPPPNSGDPISPTYAWQGLPWGPNVPGDSLWGTNSRYGLTGTYQSMALKYVLPYLRKATAAHYSFVVVMARSSQIVGNKKAGDSASWYSVKQTYKAIDSLAAILPRDTVLKYVRNGALRGYLIQDDINCGTCWGSPHGNPYRIVTMAQTDSVYKYARAKLPAELPLGIRVHPSWFTKNNSASTSRYLDFYWLQFVLKYERQYGSQKAWYDYETGVNRALPHPGKMVYGLNVYYFDEANRTRITAKQLSSYGRVALAYPAGCFSSWWKWWNNSATDNWRSAGRGPVWDSLAIVAKAKANVPTCKAP